MALMGTTLMGMTLIDTTDLATVARRLADAADVMHGDAISLQRGLASLDWHSRAGSLFAELAFGAAGRAIASASDVLSVSSDLAVCAQRADAMSTRVVSDLVTVARAARGIVQGAVGDAHDGLSLIEGAAGGVAGTARGLLSAL